MEQEPSIMGEIMFWIIAGIPMILWAWFSLIAMTIAFFDFMFLTDIGGSIGRWVTRKISKQ